MTTSENPFQVLVPCALCGMNLSIDKDPRKKNGKKMRLIDCCKANICDFCGWRNPRCLFCKSKTGFPFMMRKTSFGNWEEKFAQLKQLEKLTREPFFWEFFKKSEMVINSQNSDSIQKAFRLYIVRHVFPSFLKQVILFRLPKSFIFVRSEDIQEYKNKLMLFIQTKTFGSMYQNHFRQLGVSMQYCREYSHSGLVLLIALRLSTVCLPKADANAKIIMKRVYKKS